MYQNKIFKILKGMINMKRKISIILSISMILNLMFVNVNSVTDEKSV